MSKGNCLALLYNQNQENLQREGKKVFSAQTQTKGLKENETSRIFWGFTETNKLREEDEPAQFPPSVPFLTQLYSWQINFKFERAQIQTLLRDLFTIRSFSPYRKGFLFLVESFETIYNQTTGLNS